MPLASLASVPPSGRGCCEPRGPGVGSSAVFDSLGKGLGWGSQDWHHLASFVTRADHSCNVLQSQHGGRSRVHILARAQNQDGSNAVAPSPRPPPRPPGSFSPVLRIISLWNSACVRRVSGSVRPRSSTLPPLACALRQCSVAYNRLRPSLPVPAEWRQ